ncbi:unnamed protein product [Scytosiphon promiscuus]
MVFGFSHVFVFATASGLLPGITAFVPPHPCGQVQKCSALGAAVSPSGSSSGIGSAEEAKENLRRALKESRGSSKAPGVEEAAAVLATFNPTSSPASAWHLHSGPWTSIGEDFKGTTRTADGLECTLGRLVFNIFEPVGLPVLLTDIQNVIGPRPENTQPTSYSICTRWVSRDGSGLRGRTEISGLCWEDSSDPNRILVMFDKGYVRPDEGQELESWSKVMGVKDMEAANEKGVLSTLKEGFAKLLLKVAFGFRGPAESLGPEGELSYEMKRSPKASLDILYMDEQLRVTRGAQGALVISSRI